MSYESFNKLAVGIFVLLATILFYQSWMNIINKQLTNFSMDALVLLYIRILKGEKALVRSRKLLESEPNRLRTLGFFALCGGITAIYAAIDTYITYVH